MLRILDKRDRDDLEEIIEGLKNDVNSQLDTLEAKHDDNISELTNKHNDDKESLQTNINNLESKHNEDNTALINSINSLTTKHNNEINNLINTHNSDKQMLQDAIDAEKNRAMAAESQTLNDAKSYTDTLANGQVATNTNDIAVLTQTVANNKTELSNSITTETNRATSVENGLEARILTMEAFFKEADIDASQEFIDTLKEIQSYISSDKTGAAAISASIQNNADAIEAYKTSNDAAVQQIATDLTSETNRATQAEAKALSDAKDYADTAEADAISASKAYTDELANGQVTTNSNNITVLTNSKVDKDGNKVLTDNNLTDDLKTSYDTAYIHSQAAHAPVDAEQNVQSDFNETDTTSDAYILNKPTLGVLAAKDTVEKTDLSEEVQTLLNQTISMQVADGYIQYSTDGATWINLLAISDITA